MGDHWVRISLLASACKRGMEITPLILPSSFLLPLLKRKSIDINDCVHSKEIHRIKQLEVGLVVMKVRYMNGSEK